MCMSMDVILPQPTGDAEIGVHAAARGGGEAPCLWLLHGLSDDETIWQRRTSIERYVAPLGLAVVMPNVHRSFYTDMAHGYRYWTYVSEELPRLARSFFRISARREDNFVAGLSMGGYGAFKLALRCPQKFAAGASLSGALDMASRVAAEDAPVSDDIRLVYGSHAGIGGSADDLLHVAGELAASGAQKPRLYQWCGTEDFLHAHNTAFRDHARGLGFDLTYEEDPGDHQWSYWDRQIQRVLDWLPLGA